MTRRLFFALPLAAVPFLWGVSADYAAARRKFDLIESGRVQPGGRVTVSAPELNAWVREQARQAFPDGVRNPTVALGTASATGSALVDFGKVRRAQGHAPGWLASKLLDGERPVQVAVRLRSAGGRATVDVDSVEVSGVTIDGPLLDYLIRNYLLPNYPGAKIGEPFELGHRIERLEVRPAAFAVVFGK